jgi:hypothetical protein
MASNSDSFASAPGKVGGKRWYVLPSLAQGGITIGNTTSRYHT